MKNVWVSEKGRHRRRRNATRKRERQETRTTNASRVTKKGEIILIMYADNQELKGVVHGLEKKRKRKHSWRRETQLERKGATCL